MTRFKTFLYYSWALMGVPIVLATFMGMNFWAKKLVAITGLEVSPRFTGGQVINTVKHDEYKTLIHRPVFNGLIRERRNGFVQIKWKPNEARPSKSGRDEALLPRLIDEEIDFDTDGRSDFRIRLDTQTNEAELQAFNDEVVSPGEVLVLGNERIIRIALKRNSN